MDSILLLGKCDREADRVYHDCLFWYLKLLRILLFVCTLLLSPLPSLGQAPQSYGFPGRGNPSDWSDALPYYNLGNKYLESGRYDEAIDSFHAACARYDQDADFYINLGVAYRKVDDYQSAEQAFTKALSINDKDWMTWSNLGNALLKQKKLKQTIAAFNRSLKCNPPAKEKAAMEKDIADINKIISMSQPPAAALVKKRVAAPIAPKKKAETKDVSGWDELLK